MRGVRAVAEFHKVDGTRTLEGVTGGRGPGGFEGLGASVVGRKQAFYKEEVRAVFQTDVYRHIG